MGTERSTPRRDSIHPAIAIAAVLVGIVAMGVGIQVAPWLGLRLALITGELMLAAPGVLFVALSGVPVLAGLGLREEVRGRTAVLALFAGAALWAGSLGLMNVQFSLWPPSEQFLETFRQLHVALRPRSAGEGILSVVAIALMPALCEETLFRGIVLPSMSRRSALAGLVTTALLFALIHIDWTAGLVYHRVPFAFAVGMGLGAIRLLTGSLVPAVLAHTVINAITFSTVFLMGTAGDALEEPNPPLGAALLAGGGLAMAFLLRALRRTSVARAKLPA